jgi:hypothetical protein
MIETVSQWDRGTLIPLVAIVTGALIAITAIISGQWRRIRQAEIDAALKQEMLNRGMPAEEIERVVRASRKKSDRCP